MASPLDDPSREVTPSSSISSQNVSMDMASNQSASGGSSQGQDDVERFKKRMEMEKTLQALQQRLELASVKATNGWSDMSIKEIEEKLPEPPRRRSMMIDPIASSSRLPYEPPSPSRPWQLIDVLWQPLPPPSKGSPLSPRKRTRDVERMNGHSHGPGYTHGHRRASSAATLAMMRGVGSSGSGGDAVPPRIRKEKRSQSHSHHTTTQDVDAAKALTAMLANSSPSAPLRNTASLPIPHDNHHHHDNSQSPDMSPRLPRPRSQSLVPTDRDRSNRPTIQTPSSHTRSKLNNETPPEDGVHGEEDKDAAELMMFLAHSPSPVQRFTPRMGPTPSVGGSPSAARVLFADDTRDAKVGISSNLAMAPPITANGEEGEDPFGQWLDKGDR